MMLDIELVPPRDAPLDVGRSNGSFSALRGWLGLAIGGRSLPVCEPIGRLINWPCSIDALNKVVASLHQEFEDQRSLHLTWGEGNTRVPTYATLGLTGSFTVWFVDVHSAARLVGSIDNLRTPSLPALDGTHWALAFDRLQAVLAALPRAVPGSTFDLDATSLQQTARRLAAEVLDWERSNISHAKCLAMMPPSMLKKGPDPFGSAQHQASYEIGSVLTRAKSASPGRTRRPKGG